MDADLNKIVDIVKNVGELDELGPEQDFYKAGINSVKTMDVMLDLENEFGVTIPDDQFVQIRTAAGLLELVRRLQHA